MKYGKYPVILLLALTFALSVPALGQTSDEYYNRAVNKYFLGDNRGAVRDLKEALDLDPGNTKAKELLQEINKDSAPAAAPAPALDMKDIQKEIKKAIREESAVVAKPKPARPAAVSPAPGPPKTLSDLNLLKKPSSQPPLFALTWKDLVWLWGFVIFCLYLVIRLGSLYFRQMIDRRTVQVCTECKYANPGSAEFCGKCGARLKPWVAVTAAQRKWYARFNWNKNPFTLDIMPKLFTGYQTQVNTIFDKIYAKTGHILIMGNKGVGKTTLLKWLTDSLGKEFHTVYIPRPTDNFNDLLDYLAKQLKLKTGKRDRITIYDLEALADRSKMNILLLLDEAHEFNSDFERPLRSLGDLNGVNFILAGLTGTADEIRRMSPPFYDRIVQQVALQHLTLEETTDLVRKRIENAGGQGLGPFTPEAIENVYKMTGGVPRAILKVCDWIITEAIHNNLDVIEVGHIAGYPQEEIEKGEKENKQ